MFMIRYDLKCSEGHGFDSWFSSGNDYDKLKKAGLLSCVICGDTKVQKAIMAPRVSLQEQVPVSAAKQKQIMSLSLRQKIERLADNVGQSFASEARKMHDGDVPERPIYGEACIEDAKSLIEDGVPILPLPWSNRKPS